MQVRHDRGRIIEENHYYAFGLKIAAISSKAYGAPNNNYLYQGDFSEFDDDLGWNDFELRSYDPQIARFLPQAQDSVLCLLHYYCRKYNTLQFVFNKSTNTIFISNHFSWINYGSLTKLSVSLYKENIMSSRYKFVDNSAVYFTTSTVVGWTDIFTREIYKTILLDSIRHCQVNQGLNTCMDFNDQSSAYHLQL